MERYKKYREALLRNGETQHSFAVKMSITDQAMGRYMRGAFKSARLKAAFRELLAKAEAEKSKKAA